MAFQEVYVSQFTSPTTPYTGCRHADGYFATEGHSFHCSTDDSKNYFITVTPSPLPPPRENKCVGHDQCSDWQVFAYLDSTQRSPADDDHQQLEANVSEASESHRRTSQSSSLEASMSSLAEVAVDTPTRGDAVDVAPVAWLVLQSQAHQDTYKTCLTYRPLSPILTVSSFHNNATQSSEQDVTVVVWVGSADDSKLRCYTASGEEENRHSLDQIEVTEEAFSFDSPVMIMDSISIDTNSHLVAVGCQDGTVRAIHLECKRQGDAVSFSNISAHAILVDGPIMALHLSQHENRIHLVVGSMCGFVCRLFKILDDDDKSNGWQGPFMVADGLRNESLDSEDAVLAVDMASNDMIVLGTHAGKLMVWQQRQGESSFRLVWNCELPYSIHGLSHLVTGASNDTPTLLVTTRFTLHVFQRNAPKYCPDTAKRRLQTLIEDRQIALELLKIA